MEEEAGNKVATCHDDIGGFFLFQGHVKQNAVIKNYSSHVRQRALELQGVQQWLRERDVYRKKKTAQKTGSINMLLFKYEMLQILDAANSSCLPVSKGTQKNEKEWSGVWSSSSMRCD